MELVSFLTDLQWKGALAFVDLVKGREGMIAVTIQMHGLEKEEVDKVAELLRIAPRERKDPKGHPIASFRLVPVRRFVRESGKETREPQVPVRLRNFIEVLYLLGWGVDIPEGHAKKGTAKAYVSSNGKAYDFREYYRDLMDVRSAPRKPSNAYVSVFYRGHYYYIPDDDLRTKEVLSVLTALYDLQSAGIQSVQPLLTIPVSR